jgi:hypothetical protein
VVAAATPQSITTHACTAASNTNYTNRLYKQHQLHRLVYVRAPAAEPARHAGALNTAGAAFEKKAHHGTTRCQLAHDMGALKRPTDEVVGLSRQSRVDKKVNLVVNRAISYVQHQTASPSWQSATHPAIIKLKQARHGGWPHM